MFSSSLPIQKKDPQPAMGGVGSTSSNKVTKKSNFPNLPEGSKFTGELGQLDFQQSMGPQTSLFFSIPHEVLKEILKLVSLREYSLDTRSNFRKPNPFLPLLETSKGCYHLIRSYIKWRNPQKIVASLPGYYSFSFFSFRFGFLFLVFFSFFFSLSLFLFFFFVLFSFGCLFFIDLFHLFFFLDIIILLFGRLLLEMKVSPKRIKIKERRRRGKKATGGDREKEKKT